MFLMHRNRLVNEIYSRKGCVTRFSYKSNPRLKRVHIRRSDVEKSHR